MLPMAPIRLSRTIPLLFLALTVAQQSLLLPDSLPACVQQCPNLLNAAILCVPPSAPTAPQSTYNSCFCQSALLTTLSISPSVSLCPGICNDADYALVVEWYTTFCPTNGPPAAVPPSGPGPTTLATAISPNAPTAAVSGAEATTNAQSDSTGNQSGQLWLSTHWNWVVMVAVLAIALSIVAFLAVCLHRRHVRRRDAAENFGPRPDLQNWGPNQRSVHDLVISSTGTRTPATGTRPPRTQVGLNPEKQRADALPEPRSAEQPTGGRFKKSLGGKRG